MNNIVLLGTIYFEIKSTENCLQNVTEVRAKGKTKVEEADRMKQGVNGMLWQWI